MKSNISERTVMLRPGLVPWVPGIPGDAGRITAGKLIDQRGIGW